MKNYTQQEVLDLVINTYNINNRADVANSCQYRIFQEDGTVKKCAVGLLIPDEVYQEDWDNNSKTVQGIFDELPENIQKLGLHFLEELQDLHDFKYNWNEEGLSESGLDLVKSIKEKFNLK